MFERIYRRAHIPALVRKPTGRATHYVGHSLQVKNFLRRHSLQPKLSISSANDCFEKEAEQVADQILLMPDRNLTAMGVGANPEQQSIRRAPGEKTFDDAKLNHHPVESVLIYPNCGGDDDILQGIFYAVNGFPDIQRQREEDEEEGLIRTKSQSDNIPGFTPGLASKIQSIRRRGRPLPSADRAFFEPRFGRDFSQVRIHTDGKAGQLARAINAHAFTIGQDVVFGAGKYRPSVSGGRHLLAHELTHVVQQGAIKSGAPSEIPNRDRKTEGGQSEITTLSPSTRSPKIQRRALATATVAGLNLGGIRIFPPDLDIPMGSREERTLSLWTPTSVVAPITATSEVVPVGDQAGTFPGFAGFHEAQSLALHQSAITMIVEDTDSRIHVLNVRGAPSTTNPIRSSRFSVVGRLGDQLRIRGAVNPNLRIATRGSSWAERARNTNRLRLQYVNEELPRDQELWVQVELAYTELAVEAFSVRPVDVYVMDYRRRRYESPRPGLININLIAENVGGMAGPGELSEETAPDQQRPWLYINWSSFNAGLDAVRATFRHESIHAGTRERVLGLMARWRSDDGSDQPFLEWLQRQLRLPQGGPGLVTELDMQLAQAHLIGRRGDESLTAAMTFTTTFHRTPATGMDTSETSTVFRQLRYMLANWSASGLIRSGSGISTLREETLRRLRVYYSVHMNQPHRSAFDTWVDGLPDTGGRIMSTRQFQSATWTEVNDVVQRMRQFRRGV